MTRACGSAVGSRWIRAGLSFGHGRRRTLLDSGCPRRSWRRDRACRRAALFANPQHTLLDGGLRMPAVRGGRTRPSGARAGGCRPRTGRRTRRGKRPAMHLQPTPVSDHCRHRRDVRSQLDARAEEHHRTAIHQAGLGAVSALSGDCALLVCRDAAFRATCWVIRRVPAGCCPRPRSSMRLWMEWHARRAAGRLAESPTP